MKFRSFVLGLLAAFMSLVLVTCSFMGGLGELPRICTVDPGNASASTSGIAGAFNPSLDQAIVTQTKGDNKLAASMWLGTHLESNWKSNAVGAGSYGPYQIQNPADVPPVVHPGITSAEAMDPGKATAYMLPAYKTALVKQLRENPGLWQSDPVRAAERVAYLAERPKYDYYVTQAGNIPKAWSDTLAAMTRNGVPTSFNPTIDPASKGAMGSVPPEVPQNPTGTGCQDGFMAGGPVGQPGIVSGDASTLARRVLALPREKIQFIFRGREDFQATADGRLINPGSGGSCSIRRPVPVSAAMSQVILDIVEKGGYSITIGSTISSHDCDPGRHPQGRAVDINYINGVVITGNEAQFAAANMALYRQFMDYVQSVLPRGQWQNGRPVGMGGLGQQQCFESPRPEVPGLNIFPDKCTHIHVDVGVSAG